MDQSTAPQSCPAKFGNPIAALKGVKTEVVDLGVTLITEGLVLTYDSARHLPINGVTKPGDRGSDLPVTAAEAFGVGWNSSLHKKLFIDRFYRVARVSRGDGSAVSFDGGSVFTGAWKAVPGVRAALVTTTSGYTFIDQESGAEEYYSAAGVLTSTTLKDGSGAAFSYSDAATSAGIAPGAGYLIRVQDSLGRSLQFTYDSSGKVNQIIGPDGRTTSISYTAAGNLQAIQWPDGASRSFVYDDGLFTWALTGVVDENGIRRSTFTWDSAGRAIQTELVGGVNRYRVSHASAPEVLVTDEPDGAAEVMLRLRSFTAPAGTVVAGPNGAQIELGSVNIRGVPYLTTKSQPAGSGCSASTELATYDTSANILSKDDFRGTRTCFAYDGNHRETSRVEGLAKSIDCASVAPDDASLPVGARRLTTQWHPDWRLPIAVTNQGVLMSSTVYHGQPDPFNGGATANCTSAPNLPSGKPRALVCKQVDQNVLVDSSSLFDPYLGSVSLLIRAEGSNGSTAFVDSGPSPKPITAVGNAQISTEQSWAGGSAVKFDGSGDYLSIPYSPDFAYGAEDFTIETYFYKLGNTVYAARLWNANGDVYDGISMVIDSSGNFGVYATTTGSSWTYSLPIVAPLANGRWYHLAVVRSGGSLFAFVDGVRYTVTASLGASPLYTNAATGRVIGSQASPDRPLKGYVDEFRFTKGVARYTEPFAPSTPAPTRRMSTATYDAGGRVLSRTDPNNRVTSYSYYADTAFTGADPDAIGHTVGDLQSITNAAGHVTRFTLYDKAGRVRQSVDAKGITTDTAYTPRGWLSSTTVTPPGGAARSTSYSYDAVGQLKVVTQPDGATVTYSYDPAHRLIGVKDAKGNEISYTLDNAGNRTAEQIKDPGGTLQRSISRTFDALNRLQQVSGAAQ